MELCTLDPSIQKLSPSADSDDTPRHLRSFVDEDGVARLQASIKDFIDQAQHAQHELRTMLLSFSSTVASLHKSSLESRKISEQENLENAYSETNLIATDAHEMAMLLESLARHYDQCTQAYDLSLEVMSGKYSADVTEELAELTEVLSNDAREIDGVVTELYDRRENIATSAKAVVEFLEKVEADHAAAVSTFVSLEQFGASELMKLETKMKGLMKSQSAQLAEVLEVLLPEMASLVEYYRLFLQSYYSMILEISRRRDYQTKLKSLQEEMQRKVDKVVNGKICSPWLCLKF